ncbi:hypothetical protein BGX29_001856 [Mortierella sp. GBA35]|nr:hypothetical protein BGX29_001856 [Mortierella sp. GBA35]
MGEDLIAKTGEDLDAKEKELAEALKQANVPQTVREFGDPKNRPHMVEGPERKWTVEDWWHDAENGQLFGNGLPSTTAAPSIPSTVEPWSRGQPLPKAKSEPATTSDTPAKKDERAKGASRSASPCSETPVSNDPRDYQSNKVTHRIEEGHESHGNSAQAMEANMERLGDHTEPTIQATTPPIEGDEKAGPSNKTSAAANNKMALQKERTRNAKATRAVRDNRDSSSCRKEDNRVAAAKEEPATTTHEAKPTPEAAKTSTITNGDGRPGRMSRSAATRFSKGSYPAKVDGSNGATVSDIRIHAQLPLQSTGDQDLEPAHELGTWVKTDKSATAKSEASKTGALVQRNSLTNSNVATIFPFDVEKVARNRGSMSFMVDSEIDPPPPADLALSSEDTSAKALEESFGHVEQQDKDEAEQLRDSALVSGQQQQATDSVTSSLQDANTIGDPHSMGESTAGPSQNAIDTSVDGVAIQQSQSIGDVVSGADSSSHRGARRMITETPEASGIGHPLQPYPAMVPYYPYYHPDYAQPIYVPRGYVMGPDGLIPAPPFGAHGSAGLSSPPSTDVSHQQAFPLSSTLGPQYSFLWFPVAGVAQPEQATNITTSTNIAQSVPHQPYAHHRQGTQDPCLMSPPISPTGSTFEAGPGSPISPNGLDCLLLLPWEKVL